MTNTTAILNQLLSKAGRSALRGVAAVLVGFTYSALAMPALFSGPNSPTIDLPGGSVNGEAVAIEDLDNNGWWDVVVATSGNQPDYIYFQDQSGWSRVALSENTTAWDVAVADLDNDGWVDIYVATANAKDIIYYGSGFFGQYLDHSDYEEMSEVTDSRAVAIGDLDGNTYLDVVVATGINENHKLHRNPGNTIPITEDLDPGSGDDLIGRGVAIGDFDDDNDFDIYFTSATEEDQLFLNNGFEGFTLQALTQTTLGEAAVSGDFDGDPLNGFEALTLTASGGDFFVDVISTTFPFPTTTYAHNPLQVPPPPGANVRDHGAVGDFNNDGLEDVVAVTRNGTDFLYINDNATPGTVRFKGGETIPGTSGTRAVATIDIDYDGDLDLVFAVVGGKPFIRINNFYAPPPPSDQDGDGVDDLDDPAPTNPYICGDIDGDFCDDCSELGFFDPLFDGPDFDGDGICDFSDIDDDDDGVLDNVDSDPFDMFVCADVDGDGCDDCSQGYGFPDRYDDGPDADTDGVCDYGDEDDDNDGIPDAWEEEFGTDPLVDDAGNDNDGDGVSNLDEYVAGTNPWDPDETGQTLESFMVPGELRLRFVAEKADGVLYAGKTRLYTVQQATVGTMEWTDISGYIDIVGDDQEVIVSGLDFNGAPKIYRLLIDLDP